MTINACAVHLTVGNHTISVESTVAGAVDGESANLQNLAEAKHAIDAALNMGRFMMTEGRGADAVRRYLSAAQNRHGQSHNHQADLDATRSCSADWQC